jgi:predicted nuclease of predicted toxin-antitoxin system
MARLLRAAGHDCAHVYELGLGGQADEQIMALADREERILISADTDFGELLANAPVLAPSVILLRRADNEPNLSPQSSSRTSARSPTTWPQAR